MAGTPRRAPRPRPAPKPEPLGLESVDLLEVVRAEVARELGLSSAAALADRPLKELGQAHQSGANL